MIVLLLLPMFFAGTVVTLVLAFDALVIKKFRLTKSLTRVTK